MLLDVLIVLGDRALWLVRRTWPMWAASAAVVLFVLA